MLAYDGRVKFRIEVARWIEQALERPKIELLPFTAAAAVRAASLGGSFPGDPADRFIVGTALEMGVPIVTRDRRISNSGLTATIW